jgi:glyoxylase-like metal-dependent hydrolase (beta-lactamase superfamily II)
LAKAQHITGEPHEGQSNERTVTIIDKGNVRVHTYVAPIHSLNVTTQLIETPSRLIAVDGQITVANAEEVVAYTNGLGKPLDRLTVTHAHPDH